MPVFTASHNYAARRPATRPARNSPSNGVVKTDASGVSSQSSATSSQVPVKYGANFRANTKNRGNYEASIGHRSYMFWPWPSPSPLLIPPYQTLPYTLNYVYPPFSFSDYDPVDNVTRLKLKIAKQIEYYFSDNNLAKDVYLRMKMDSEGWVPITLIARFRKVYKLTKDSLFVQQSLMDSTIVELQGEKVRRRDNWKKWLLNYDERILQILTHRSIGCA